MYGKSAAFETDGFQYDEPNVMCSLYYGYNRTSTTGDSENPAAKSGQWREKRFMPRPLGTTQLTPGCTTIGSAIQTFALLARGLMRQARQW